MGRLENKEEQIQFPLVEAPEGKMIASQIELVRYQLAAKERRMHTING
jgi:iron-sulfur cluster repair protein YtfE (RIC family)